MGKYLILLGLFTLLVHNRALGITPVLQDSTTLTAVIEEKIAAYKQENGSLKEIILPYVDSAKKANNYGVAAYVLTTLLVDYYQQSSVQDKIDYKNQVQEIVRERTRQFFEYDQDSSLYWLYQEGRANLLYQQGLYPKSISAYKRLVNHKKVQNVEDSLYLNAWYSYLGSSYLALDNADRAIVYYKKYLDFIPQSVVDYYGADYLVFYKMLGWSYLGGCWNNKSSGELDTQNYERALACYHKALSMIGALENPSNFNNTILSTYSGLVSLHQHYKYYDSASIYLNRSGKFFEANYNQTARVLFLRGKDAFKKGRFDEALKYYDKAIGQEKKIAGDLSFSLYDKFMEKARVYKYLKDYDSAAVFIDKSIRLLTRGNKVKNIRQEDIIYVNEAINSLHFKAGFLAEQAKVPSSESAYAEALTLYDLAIKLSLNDRDRHLRAESRQQRINNLRVLIADALNACYSAQQYLPQQDVFKLAFKFIENGKALLLSEDYRDELAFRKIGLERPLIRKLDSLKGLMKHYGDEVRTVTVRSEVDPVFDKLRKSELSYDSLRHHLEEKFPQHFVASGLRGIDFNDVYENLPKDMAYLSYYAGDTAIYLLAGNESNSALVKINDYQTIGNKIGDVLNFSRSPAADNKKTYISALHYLFEGLVAPVYAIITGQDRLLILPDGYLSYLPFDLLLTDISETAFDNLQYMIRQWSIGYNFSVGAYIQAINNKDTDYKLSYLGFAPSYSGQSVKDMMATGKDPLTFIAERNFGPLAYNQQEVKNTNELFGGKLFLDEEATESNFRMYSANVGVLHLSMHAFYDEQNPDHSGLLFSDFNPEAHVIGTDGFVPMIDLYKMHLNAELAIISACETGYGFLERGEGVASIGRAFKYAGCPTVTMSLWNANDRSTAAIMESFTELLKEGMTKDKALQQAKLNYLNEADAVTAHPYYWSAFLVNGNMGPLSMADNDLNYLIPLILILVLLAVFIAIFVKQKFTIERKG